MHALPIMLLVLACLAVAYRYYSAFLATRVAVLDDTRQTPAFEFNDGQNYHPTHKWVLFGHHFAAISGAGPLIGPVLAIQFGYLPGLVWLVVGVCLAGAVQDMLVLAASVRRGGRSLAEIARAEIGPLAGTTASIAILFVVVIALSGLGVVVVKALGGEEIKLAAGTLLEAPEGTTINIAADAKNATAHLPPGTRLTYLNGGTLVRSEAFDIVAPLDAPRHEVFPLPMIPTTPAPPPSAAATPSAPFVKKSAIPAGKQPTAPVAKQPVTPPPPPAQPIHPGALPHGGPFGGEGVDVQFTGSGWSGFTKLSLPPGARQFIAGSSWGTFTIACTVPIALLIGLYMYKIRKGRVVEASLIGAAATLVATVVGNWIPGSALEPYFSLTREQTIWAICIYGFIASVLPVWMLLCPRDYLSSFLKIGTVVLLVAAMLVANPKLEAPAVNPIFASGGGPYFDGPIFPFCFICIMCGAISGFHALVASGTTPKMIMREGDVRTIGYGAMLIEGLVGIVALLAAASLPQGDYWAINIDLARVEKYADNLVELGASTDNLPEIERQVGGESLRGRTGGAVTLAVGMSRIFTEAMRRVAGDRVNLEAVIKYWYHFAIMFEALFILTTIDTGTRIARFLLQEALGKIYKPFDRTDWLPGAVLSTAVVTAAWGGLIWTGSIETIWPMFGIANQMLAVIALAVVTTVTINSGRQRYAWLTIFPLLFVIASTSTAAFKMVNGRFAGMFSDGYATHNTAKMIQGGLNIFFTLFMVGAVMLILVEAVTRWMSRVAGKAAQGTPDG